MKRPIIAAFVAAVLASPALADFDQGLTAYRAGDFDRAFNEFRADALAGHPTAQFNLGIMYYRGQGVARDPVSAWAWVELATQHRGQADLREAQQILGVVLTPEEVEAGTALAHRLAMEHDLRFRGSGTDPARVAIR